MSYIGNEPIVSATRTITEITATAGQTVFVANGGYTVGYIDVFVNGAQLQTSDFTASNGSSITLTEAAQVGDVIRLVAWGTFSTATHVQKSGDTVTGGLNVLGNLGVGTSSPAVSIDARKASDVQIRAFETGLGVDTRVVSVGGGGQAGIIGTYSNHPLVTYTNGVERVRVDTAGRVTTPAQPAFKAGRSLGNVGSNTRIVFHANFFNIGNNFNNTTGVFTAPVAGRYLFAANLFSENNTSPQAQLRKNGSKQTWILYTGGGFGSINLVSVIDLAANDTVEVYVDVGTVYASGDNADCTFSGYLIG